MCFGKRGNSSDKKNPRPKIILIDKMVSSLGSSSGYPVYCKTMQQRSIYFIPAVHLLIWGCLLAIPAFLVHDPAGNTGLPGSFFLFANLYHIGLFYLNAYFLYPRLFNRKKGWYYLQVVALIIYGSYYSKVLLLKAAIPSFAVNSTNKPLILYPPIAFLSIGIVFRLIADKVKIEKLEKERKAERLASELKFLRSQISPHFLFNTMANMVSLARQKSDQLESSLLKLSDLLRYMLYESGEEKFLLSKEILYLRSYIEIQQLRFGEDLDLLLEIDDGADCIIEPMLLVPFVENAFKHGIGLVEKPFINIGLRVAERHLSFVVANNYNNRDLSKDQGGGIGLDNVRTRLNLLYPGRYKLNIKDNGGIYEVNLNLDLTC
jgi:two-component system, LytTR family, sensor kinase